MKKLYVGNLSYDTTVPDLTAHFEQDGRKVVSCQIMTDRDTGRSRGFAFVELEDDGAAQEAIAALDGQQLDGRTLKINEAQEKPKFGPGGPGFRGGRGFGGGGGGGRGGPRGGGGARGGHRGW